MVSASQIRDLIRSYLSGSLSLQRFAEAFEAVYSEINVASEQDVLAFGDHIQVLLSRVSAGIASENELKGWLQALSQTSNPSSFERIVRPEEDAETYSFSEGYLISA